MGINIRVLVIQGVVFLLFIAKLSIGHMGEVGKEPIFMRTFNRVENTPDEFCHVSYNILCDKAILNNPGGYLPLSKEEKLKQPNPTKSLRHKQLMREVSLWLIGSLGFLLFVDLCRCVHMTNIRVTSSPYRHVASP